MNPLNKHARAGLAGLVLACTAATSTSGSVTTTLPVTATVVAGCSSLQVGAMDFGAAYVNTFYQTTAAITIDCDAGVAYTLDSQRVGNRVWDGAANNAGYELYKDAARTQVWGGANGTTITGSATGGAQVIMVYGKGKILLVGPGTYVAAETVTLTF